MRRITLFYILFIVALFSVALVTHASVGLEGSDITGYVVDATNDIQLPDGEICTDNDDGRAYVKGETAVFESIAYDYCLDEQRLVEYSCVTLFRTSEIIVCPFGCREGACI